jgi:hypothetical protein
MSPLLKTIAFLFLFLYVLPFMTVSCIIFPTFRHVCFAGMFYFTSNEYSLNIAPMPRWTGTARGYAYTAVSLFAAPLFLSMVFDVKQKVRFFPPGSFFYFLYYLAILLSGMNAIHMQQWGFEVCKMFWMYITFLAAFNYLNNTKDLKLFIYVVCSVLIVMFLVGFNQKYRIGKFQISSTFPHQNSLSLYLEIFGLLALGVLMNERISRLLFLMTLGAFCGSLLLIIFTYSRGGLVVFFGGIAIVCALSILVNGFSIRRLTLMLVGMIFVLGIVGYALPRIIQRFNRAPEASKNTRINLAIAAKRIANDYTFGIGANNFTEYSGPARNYATEMYVDSSAGFLAQSSGRGGIVETIYLLVAAECGWWGLGALLLWFLYYYFSDAVSMFVLRGKPCSGFVIGLFGGLTCNYWHSTLEWSLKQYNNFAGQMIVYALIAAIAVNRKNIVDAYNRNMARRKAMPVKKRSGLPPLIPPERLRPAPTEKNGGPAQIEPEHIS